MGVTPARDALCEGTAAAAGAAGRLAAAIALLLLLTSQALALEPISIPPEADTIDITVLGELYEGRGDRLQIETAAGTDGITGRMIVQALTPGTNPSWFVFALHNPSGDRMVRWLVAPRYATAGSGVFWPDLDQARITAVTPSLGFRPERVPDERADIFRITLEPGATITMVAELSSVQVPRISLWKSEAYERKLRDRFLFQGIMLGIVGVLAIFLTSVFAANHKSIFPAAALLAWSALAVFCVDFGFWHKLFQMSVEDSAIHRAAAEAAFAASLVLFIYTFLKISHWHRWIKFLFGLWILGQLSLAGLAVLDPRLAAGLARASFVPIGAVGTALVVYLVARGQERALSLVPSWMLLLVWIFAAAMVVSGKLAGEVVVSGLVSGLVLLLVLLGFTVTQYAFRSDEPPHIAPQSAGGDARAHMVAIEASGAGLWEWNMRRNEIILSGALAQALGMPEGPHLVSAEDWLHQVHAAERERVRLAMAGLREGQEGEIATEFRLRHADGSYLWFELRARALDGPQGRARCIGLMRDVTHVKRTQERLMHDAVHDSLTGLPNRELFLDRLNGALTRAREGDGKRPTVMFIDIDRFKNVNRSLGLVVGDSMLLTLARRLARHLNPQDTLARIGGDQFAILLVSGAEPNKIAMLAERVRRSLRSPMKIGGKEIILTGSIGIAVYDGQQISHQELLKEAEIAMYRAKRAGTDRIDIFQPSMRNEEDNRLPLESDLRRALDRQQIKVLYQPITRLSNNSLAGFEALVRWDHPTLGRLSPEDFVPIAEETGLITELGSYVLEQAVEQAGLWQKTLPRAHDPLHVSVNISSRQLFRQDLAQQIRLILSRDTLAKSSLRLEITESLVMENPERAIEILGWLKHYGARLSLDDFGTGYSSLAYLHRFPFDTIKVDKSLVRETDDGGSVPVILKSVVTLAHQLGKEVVAEGVESAADADYLRSIGCEFAQGFYYGEAMGEKEVAALLSALAKKQTGSEGTRGKVRKLMPRKVAEAEGDDEPIVVEDEDEEPPNVVPSAGQA